MTPGYLKIFAPLKASQKLGEGVLLLGQLSIIGKIGCCFKGQYVVFSFSTWAVGYRLHMQYPLYKDLSDSIFSSTVM